MIPKTEKRLPHDDATVRLPPTDASPRHTALTGDATVTGRAMQGSRRTDTQRANNDTERNQAVALRDYLASRAATRDK